MPGLRTWHRMFAPSTASLALLAFVLATAKLVRCLRFILLVSHPDAGIQLSVWELISTLGHGLCSAGLESVGEWKTAGSCRARGVLVASAAGLRG